MTWILRIIWWRLLEVELYLDCPVLKLCGYRLQTVILNKCHTPYLSKGFMRRCLSTSSQEHEDVLFVPSTPQVFRVIPGCPPVVSEQYHWPVLVIVSFPLPYLLTPPLRLLDGLVLHLSSRVKVLLRTWVSQFLKESLWLLTVITNYTCKMITRN
jgi:hypothetical protein